MKLRIRLTARQQFIQGLRHDHVAHPGRASTFNEVANAIIDWHGKGEIVYIPFPEQLKDSYQSFTEADIGALTAAGYETGFMDVRSGVSAYLKVLDERR